jgi:antitoxin (DNA-binding transcriptional repressor) of toxin-antitoxin stability system
MKPTTVSKSNFKAYALEIFRQVEQTREPVIITDRGRPVLKFTAFRGDPAAALRILRKSVVKYTAPTAPVGKKDWESGE